jgi:hypothetical protein
MRSLLLATVLVSACSTRPAANPAVTSQQTSLAEANCRKASDADDPNNTPYLVCPGVAGYTLTVRQVESGRTSIDVTDPSGKAFPLRYQEVITRFMFGLEPQAEWRILTENGKPTPIALIVTLHAHEDPSDPAKATATYVAVAKITAQEICVTDKLPKQAPPDEAVRQAAASARNRPCLAPLP